MFDVSPTAHEFREKHAGCLPCVSVDLVYHLKLQNCVTLFSGLNSRTMQDLLRRKSPLSASILIR